LRARDDARIATNYVDGYHHRPHSGLRTAHRRKFGRPGKMDNDY